MRVMTWNVWGRFGPWEQRKPGISETIGSVRPDLLALQETWSSGSAVQAEALASEHGLHTTFARSHMPDDRDASIELGLAVLTRWPISAARPIRLSTGEGVCTVALIVQVQHPKGTLHLMTACLDWEEGRQDHRLQQIRELMAILTSRELDGPLPVILAGDLNAPPHAREIQALAAGMSDCWEYGQHDAGLTFDSANPFVPSDDWHTDARIDYIFARPGRPQDALRVGSKALAGRGRPGGTPPSDHYAVVVELSTVA